MNGRQSLRCCALPRGSAFDSAKPEAVPKRAKMAFARSSFWISFHSPFHLLERHVDHCCIGRCSELANSMSHGGHEGVYSTQHIL
jgi:hypothetical protein